MKERRGNEGEKEERKKEWKEDEFSVSKQVTSLNRSCGTNRFYTHTKIAIYS